MPWCIVTGFLMEGEVNLKKREREREKMLIIYCGTDICIVYSGSEGTIMHVY